MSERRRFPAAHTTLCRFRGRAKRARSSHRTGLDSHIQHGRRRHRSRLHNVHRPGTYSSWIFLLIFLPFSSFCFGCTGGRRFCTRIPNIVNWLRSIRLRTTLRRDRLFTTSNDIIATWSLRVHQLMVNQFRSNRLIRD